MPDRHLPLSDPLAILTKYQQDPNTVNKTRAKLPARAIAVLANKVGVHTTAERVAQHGLYKAAHALKVAADFVKPAAKAAQYIAEGGAVSMGMALPGTSDAVLKAAKIAATGFVDRLVTRAEARQEQRAAMAVPPKSQQRARTGPQLAFDLI